MNIRNSIKYFVIFFLLLPCSLHAEMTKLSLDEILKNARSKNAELSSVQWQEKIMQLETLRVDAEFAPRINSRIGVGPATEVTGNALASVSNTGKFGAAFIGNIEFSWPLWAWGRKQRYLDAVRSGVLVKSQESEEKWLEIVYRIKEAYYGFLLAKTLGDFLGGAIEKVEESASSEKKIKKIERYKLEILLSQAKQKKADIDAAFKIAQMGLRIFSGFEKNIKLQTEWFSYQRRELKNLGFYLMKLKDHPKFKMIQAGLQAKESLISAEKKGRLPVLGLIARYDFASSEVREDQQSIFAYDPFNHSEAMLGVGLLWNLTWGAQDAKLQKLRAESAQLKTQRQYARSGLAGLVEKAWIEVGSAAEKVSLAKKAQRAGKKWLGRKAIAAGVGFVQSQDLIEAFLARANTKTEYLQALYNYELAWAALEKSVGSRVLD